MEWFFILIIVLLSIAGVAAGVVVCLHVFECTILYRQSRDSQFGLDVSLNVSSLASSNGPAMSQVEIQTPQSVATRNFRSVVGLGTPSTAYPGTPDMIFSSPATTASSAFASPDMSQAEPAAPAKPLLSYIELRRNRDTTDVEKNESMGSGLKELGW